MNSMLAIDDESQVDDSIRGYKKFGYLPISGTNLNNANPIVIRVENSDTYFRPCDSEIEFEGVVVKKSDGAVYKKAEVKLALSNNGLMFLFDNIRYELSSTEIESVYQPGQATTMFGLLTKNESFNNGGGLNSCWAPDDNDGTAKDENDGWEDRKKMLFGNNVMGTGVEDPNSGSFRFSVRLEDIFGFATDYNRVMYGFTHTLTLVRNLNHKDAMFGADGALEPDIKFTRISWILPNVEPSQVANYELVKLINEQRTLSIDFRARQCLTTVVPNTDTFFWHLGIRTSPEKPRYLVVGFQTDREGDLEKNLGLFDHCNLKNTYVLLNNRRYPAMDYQTDFAKNRYNRLYREFYQFMQKFYGISHSVSSTSVDPITYKHLFPLLVYDVSRQSERIQQAILDITIQFYFGATVPVKTKGYCLMISDRRLKFKSDGSKASIVY